MRLVICGNGFDIHHGLLTGYRFYKKFLNDNYNSSFSDFENFEYVGLTESDLWSDLEKSLELNYEDLVYDSLSTFYPDISSDTDSRWDDFSVDIGVQTEFIKEFTGENFLKWIEQIDYSTVEKELRMNKKDIYITFNYTSTLEYIYEIPKENVLHIHGEMQSLRDSNPIQFGSIYNNPEIILKELETQYGSDDFYGASIQPGVNKVIDFCEKSFKNIENNYPTLQKFLENKCINEIVIMGHTLNGVDYGYYKNIIIPKFKNCKWVFYYHSQESKGESILFASNNKIENVEYRTWESNLL